ncbi:MAG: hypothetical protein HC850_17635 [Rhodomicrobium sp.]|nr:hypothetical protein [Rhodomicrobium sp.]
MPVPSRQAFDSASAFVLCTMPAISESATVCKTATLSRPLRAAYVTGSQGF